MPVVVVSAVAWGCWPRARLCGASLCALIVAASWGRILGTSALPVSSDIAPSRLQPANITQVFIISFSPSRARAGSGLPVVSPRWRARTPKSISSPVLRSVGCLASQSEHLRMLAHLHAAKCGMSVEELLAQPFGEQIRRVGLTSYFPDVEVVIGNSLLKPQVLHTNVPDLPQPGPSDYTKGG